MPLRRTLTLLIAGLLTLALAAPALATPVINPDTGKNIYAWPKPHTIWSAHIAGTAASEQGEVQLLETACHDGVGVRIVAPGLTEPTGGTLIVHTGSGTFEIPLADYQVMVGFAFVLDHWPTPWPIEPVYLDPEQTMPLFVEWDDLFGAGTLTPEMLFQALADGAVDVELYAGDGTVWSGIVR